MRTKTPLPPNRWLVAFALANALILYIILAIPSRAIEASGEAISGAATVIDGDTIEIAGRRVRLEGIDAPETGQTCGGRWFVPYACGTRATDALRKLVDGKTVVCENRGADKYGRTLGICRVDKLDINAEQVRTGNAWAFIKYSRTYLDVEAEARTAKTGIWQGDSEPAWIYREKRWSHAEQTAPQGCAIKGNVTRNGQIYHMPWSPWYSKVTIDEARGERWFCSEKEAELAGWRPALTQ